MSRNLPDKEERKQSSKETCAKAWRWETRCLRALRRKFHKPNYRHGEEIEKAGDIDWGLMVERLGMEFDLFPESPGKPLNGFKQGKVGSNSCSSCRIIPLTFNQGVYL